MTPVRRASSRRAADASAFRRAQLRWRRCPSHRLLLAEVDGRTAGWASFGGGREDGMTPLGELAGLYVHPDFWSRKIGHALLQ
ncbi:GNAT family N-acetyltransferase [Salinibacterium sp. NK8237]|uniref:GNAT family N-acetyltransferase n=1 Tax=Salinibacterium sp. NK8237 TaxID=2792038 RepID=UPI0018CD62F8|nr:GNAT family N-acetyltransferase [Salinibacterium sp. NK8237]